MSLRYCHHTILRIIVLFPLISASALTGPPFKTDDPQPVDYLHWEFYIASEQQFMKHETDATYPHIEINYGAISNVQLHIVAPLGYVHTNEGTHYGYSDTEIGLKYRFVEETETVPQIGFFPLIEIPTGNENEQLGNGKTQAYLPLWIQKSWGKLTTYGGGGVWYNPGPDRKNWAFTGWEIQYDFSELITLGSEFYYQTAETQDSESSAGFNLGGFVNLNEHHHILFSLGHNISGETAFTGYIGYQLTI
ncbi:MAG: hypothetical protein ABR936_03760 [Bacteroidota bacterium]